MLGAQILAVDNAELLSIEGGLTLTAPEAALVIGLVVVQHVLLRRVNDHAAT